MWNRILKPQIYEKWSKIELLHVKLEMKLEKLGFLGRIMRTHEQARVRSQDYAYVGFSLETLAT